MERTRNMREETKTGGVRIRMREMVKWRVDAGIGVNVGNCFSCNVAAFGL
jgi:hypothetical protein